MARVVLSGTLAACAASVLLASSAHAGGLTLPVSGVRPSGRAGAFVAGADDGSALWYNPAGLAAQAGGKKHALMLDLAAIQHPVTYTRIDSGGNPQPAVENDPQPLPHPNIVGTFDLDSRWVLAVGLLTPYASLDGYPEDGPQRYQLISLHNTTLAYLDVALAWKPSDTLWVGAGLSNLIVGFNTRVVFSSCPAQTTCAPEDPEYDAVGELSQRQLFTPSGVIGAIWKPSPKVSIGGSFRLPYFVNATGDVRVRLPSSSFFDGAHMEGDQGDLEMTLPSVLRLGIETRPSERFRAEVAFHWEAWSQHDNITLTPRNIRIEDQAGVGIYELGPIVIPRNLKDTYAIGLGIETQPLPALPFDLRAGYMYETGAVDDKWVSLLSPDANKHLFTVGASFRLASYRFDAMFSHASLEDHDVSMEEGCVPQQNPIRTGEGDPVTTPCDTSMQPSPNYVYVNAGTYKSSWTVFGVGMNAEF